MEILQTNPREGACVELPSDAFVAWCLAAAQRGDVGAYFDLGVAFSTGREGFCCDLVEAHKWFNIAATAGHEASALCRADLAREMTSREVAEAQRRAREWLAGCPRKAAA
jgi:TPR repeat protein